MATDLRPGLPAEAYHLGDVVGVVRPSLRSWAVGILPAGGWCLGFTAAGLVFALAFLSEPFAFLLNIGWAAVLLPIILPLCGLYLLGSHLARNLSGRVFILDGGVVLMPRAAGDARVYRWADVRGFQDGNAAPPSQSGAESATVFAHGSDQCTAHTSDGSAWVFGSDLRGFAQLRGWFQQKAAGRQPPPGGTPADPSAAADPARV